MSELEDRIANQVSNLLAIRGQYKIKIIDYGFSKIITNEIALSGLKSKFGVPCTMAPEVEKFAQVAYDERIDVWGIGVTFFILVTSRGMFNEDS